MDEYIRRSDAINAIESLPTWWADEGGYYGGMQQPMVALLEPEDVIYAIKNIPSADVAEVRHGKWLQNGEPDSHGNAQYECSNCHAGDEHAVSVEVPYCWKCGARMDGE